MNKLFASIRQMALLFVAAADAGLNSDELREWQAEDQAFENARRSVA